MFYVTFLLIFGVVCKLCKSFDKKKTCFFFVRISKVDIETTSCVYREGDLFCVNSKAYANLCCLHPNLRDL